MRFNGIVLLLKDSSGVLGSSETRAVGVVIGCGVALLVTVIASQIEKRPVRTLG